MKYIFPLAFVGFVNAQISVDSPSLNIAWGLGTSAYQIEGAWNVDDKGLSIWDKWYQGTGREGNGNGFTAADHYHRMKDDIALLGSLNATMYRFSVAWSRILPNCSGTINQKGIDFYNNMIDELLRNGVTPVLTLFHWDTPQACHDQYGSWLNTKIITDFTNYADIIFQNFGDRVQYYLTLNEPHAECGWGFAQRFWPPGLNQGLPAQYQCQHLTNLAHASVVNLARSKYKEKNFKFGMPLIASYAQPASNSAADVAAAKRSMSFELDWNMSPLINGDYSAEMRADPTIGPLLPTYTQEQQNQMKGTIDYIAINYYSAKQVKYDANAVGNFVDSGVSLGPISGTPWQTIYPAGIRGILGFLKEKYPNLDIIVSECGVSVPDEKDMNLDQVVNDSLRQRFFAEIVGNLTLAINTDKVPVTAFLGWALLDNFEWNTYDQRFGVIAVDYQNNTLTRTPKKSSTVLKNAFKNAKSPFAVAKPKSGDVGKGGKQGTNNTINSAVSNLVPSTMAVGLLALSLVL